MEAKDKKIWTTLGIIVGGIILYKIIGNYKNKSRSGTPSSGGVIVPNVNSTELLRLQRMANQLFDAMNNCGTDNEGVSTVISEVRNQQDWQNLITAYGTRTLTSQWWCVGVSEFTGNLPSSIKKEMSSSEVTNLNSILSSKGVTTTI
jgi:hypothetical protein